MSFNIFVVKQTIALIVVCYHKICDKLPLSFSTKSFLQEVIYTCYALRHPWVLTSFFIKAANTTPAISAMRTKNTMIAYCTE